MASVNADDRLQGTGQDGGGPPYPMDRQATIAHPLEQTYGYSKLCAPLERGLHCQSCRWMGLGSACVVPVYFPRGFSGVVETCIETPAIRRRRMCMYAL
jgi:hypothetical protein